MKPAGLAEAERAGFEPAMEFDPHTRLAGECLQPLGHLSGERDASVEAAGVPARGGPVRRARSARTAGVDVPLAVNRSGHSVRTIWGPAEGWQSG
jgi:hypothetical protein